MECRGSRAPALECNLHYLVAPYLLSILLHLSRHSWVNAVAAEQSSAKGRAFSDKAITSSLNPAEKGNPLQAERTGTRHC